MYKNKCKENILLLMKIETKINRIKSELHTYFSFYATNFKLSHKIQMHTFLV